MQFPELISNEQTFLRLREQYSALFHADRRLPEQVFKRDFSNYYSFEHGEIMRKEFAVFLADLANRAGDKTLNYMTIEPDPVDYYRKYCGFYGLASFSASTIIDDYIRVMYRDGSADSFRVRGGDVGVLWGESLKWGIFCDRRSWEMCLLGSDVLLDESTMKALGCMDASMLERYILNMYSNKGSVGRKFLTEFKWNYPSLR